MKAVIYLRVSTKEQAEEGYSIPAQAEACRQRRAAAKGFAHSVVHLRYPNAGHMGREFRGWPRQPR